MSDKLNRHIVENYKEKFNKSEQLNEFLAPLLRILGTGVSRLLGSGAASGGAAASRAISGGAAASRAISGAARAGNAVLRGARTAATNPREFGKKAIDILKVPGQKGAKYGWKLGEKLGLGNKGTTALSKTGRALGHSATAATAVGIPYLIARSITAGIEARRDAEDKMKQYEIQQQQKEAEEAFLETQRQNQNTPPSSEERENNPFSQRSYAPMPPPQFAGEEEEENKMRKKKIRENTVTQDLSAEFLKILNENNYARIMARQRKMNQIEANRERRAQRVAASKKQKEERIKLKAEADAAIQRELNAQETDGGIAKDPDFARKTALDKLAADTEFQTRAQSAGMRVGQSKYGGSLTYQVGSAEERAQRSKRAEDAGRKLFPPKPSNLSPNQTPNPNTQPKPQPPSPSSPNTAPKVDPSTSYSELFARKQNIFNQQDRMA